MSNVIGPIPQEDWNLMSTIVKNMPEFLADPQRYKIVIEWEKEILHDLRKKYLTTV